MGCGCSARTCPICGRVSISTDGFVRKRKSEVFNKIQPLDTIFFRTSQIDSAIIRKVQGSALGHGEFSHVAIVVNSSIMPIIELGGKIIPGKLYVLETTLDKTTPDVITGKYMTGVQVRELSSLIDEYSKFPGAIVAWGKLKNNPLLERPSDLCQLAVKLTEYYFKVLHKSYELSLHLFLAVLANPTKQAEDDTYFCSELVAGVYQAAGLFPPLLDSETIAPVELLCNTQAISPRFEQPIVLVPD